MIGAKITPFHQEKNWGLYQMKKLSQFHILKNCWTWDLALKPIHSLITSHTSIWISIYYTTTVDYIKSEHCSMSTLDTMAEVSSAWLNELFQAFKILDHKEQRIWSFQRHSQHVSRLESPSGEWQWTGWESHQKEKKNTIYQTFVCWKNEGKRMAREFTRHVGKWHQCASIGPRWTRLMESNLGGTEVWRILEVIPGMCESHGWAALHWYHRPQLC